MIAGYDIRLNDKYARLIKAMDKLKAESEGKKEDVE